MSQYLLKQKLRVRGKSGIVHVVDVVCINGEKFVYIDLNKERIMEVLSKFITCIDAGLKAYVRANRTLSDLAIEIIEKVGGILDIVKTH